MSHMDMASQTRFADTKPSRGDTYQRDGKRCFDVALGLALLPIIVSVLLWVLFLSRISGGVTLFGHTRFGRNGQQFTCWKVQKMFKNSNFILAQHLANNPCAAS